MNDLVERLIAASQLLNEAAEKIKELEDCLRWTPIEDGIPTEYEYVEYTGMCGTQIGRAFLESSGTISFMEAEDGPHHIGTDEQGQIGVTHWRRIPKDPTADQILNSIKTTDHRIS